MTKMLNTKAFEKWLKAQAEIIQRYRQVEKSTILAEYNELKETIDSLEFQSNKGTFRRTLLGKLRWLSTPMHQQEKKLQKLSRNLEIQLFESYTEDTIAHLESYKTVWADEFDNTELSKVWKSGFLYPTGLKNNHSHVAEQQAYTQGQNTHLSSSNMRIVTKKEKTTAPAWHPTKGMIMHPFAYTSDIWHTAEAVAPKAGVLQVKVCCSGKAQHAICLTKANTNKAISILPEKKQKGYVIYTIVWNEKDVITYTNNVEIARVTNPLAGSELHLVLRSYLPEKQGGTGKLEIDWIRVYTNA